MEAANVTTLSEVFVTKADFDGLVLLLWATLVFFMQAGFAMLEAGSVQRGMSVNILFKNMIDSSIVALFFWAVGFGLAFGEPSNAFAGTGYFFLIGAPTASYVFFFFQYSFTTTTATIVSGGAAGRLRISAYMIYCVAMGSVIHPVVVHWIWSSSGWLNAYGVNGLLGVGMMDFAGGVAVHVNGGMATLVAIVIGGYRNQLSSDPANPPRYEPVGNGKWRTNTLQPASARETTYGAFILWFGFFAFNMGSFITFTGRSDLVGLVGINTALCSAAGALSAVFFSQIYQRIMIKCGRLASSSPWQMDDVINGTLIGLVAATSNCAVVRPWASVVIGSAAGIVLILLVNLMDRARLDDPVQAVPVHMGGGVCAVIGSALFAAPELVKRVYNLPADPVEYGLFMGGGGLHLATTVIGLIAVSCFTGLCTALVLGPLYCIDKYFSVHYFFMRSSYQTERVAFADDDLTKDAAALGIADVTDRNMAKDSAAEPSNMVMFAQTPREVAIDFGVGDESPEKRKSKQKKNKDKEQRKRLKFLRKQIKRSRNAESPDYELKAISPSFEKSAVEL